MAKSGGRRREAGLKYCEIQKLQKYLDFYLALGRGTPSQMIDSEKGESFVPGQETILLQSLRKEAKGHKMMASADLFQITEC